MHPMKICTLTRGFSFFLVFVGLSSSSSRLTLDATLESALIIFILVMPLVFVVIVVSSVEFGVTSFERNE